MTELQRIEFDMLQEFIRICEKLNLKYYLVCGSALGAVKYGGFIPWDDDLDIGMPRQDYEKFICEAQIILPAHIFLQTYKTDRGFPLIFCKLRNSKTTFVEESLSGSDINHGVYIDIFPIDGYPLEKEEQRKLEKNKKVLNLLRLSAIKSNSKMRIPTKVFRKVERICGVHKKIFQILGKYDRLISEYRLGDSKIWCNHGNWQGKLEYATREQYGNGTWSTFEGLKVRIPERFDEYLTQKYGDWRADLPEDQKRSHHYTTVIDLERPYTDYIVKCKNGKIRIKTKEELDDTLKN